jgi:hypothetical protein
MMMMIIMKYECEREMVWDGRSAGEGREKRKGY